MSKKRGRAVQQYWLRPLGLDDIPMVAKWLEDPEDLALFDRRVPVPIDPGSMVLDWRDSIEAREPRTDYWFMIRNAGEENIGVAGLANINYVHGGALMPMLISRELRGQGVGTRIRALLLDLAFHQLRLVRVTSLHRADNVASRKINEACGFKREGCIRRACFANGQHVDQMVYGILAEEWQVRRETLSCELGDDIVVTLGNQLGGRWSWPRSHGDETGHRSPAAPVRER